MEYLKSNPKAFFEFLDKTQSLIQETHKKVQSIDPQLLSHRPNHTAHPIRNYKHRFIDFNSEATNSFLDVDPVAFNNFDFTTSPKENFQNLYYLIIYY